MEMDVDAFGGNVDGEIRGVNAPALGAGRGEARAAPVMTRDKRVALLHVGYVPREGPAPRGAEAAEASERERQPSWTLSGAS
jgi:hypothetical protein